MPNLFKGVVKLTEEQYKTLLQGGSFEVDGQTITYDENTLYVTDYSIDSELNINSLNPVTNKAIATAIENLSESSTANGVTIDTNQDITGNKNFTGEVTKNGVNLATIDEVPTISDSLSPQYKDNAMSVNQGIILNEKITSLVENINGRVQSFSIDNLTDLGTLFGIDTSEVKDEYVVSSNTITYKDKEYTLKTGDIFLIVDVEVPDYWFSLDDMKLFKMETMKVDLTKYATIENLKDYLPLSGGTMRGPIVLSGGDWYEGAGNIQLDNDGQITAKGTSVTLFGRTNNGSDLYIGGSSYNTVIRGKQTRPTYNGKDMALYGDLPSLEGLATEEYVRENGGKIDKIKVNGVEQTITDKVANLVIDIPEPETITDYYKVKNKLSAVDLNTVVVPGNYGIVKDCGNMPVAENGTLFVGNYDNNQYAQQIFVAGNNTMYIRSSTSIDNSSWSSWVLLAKDSKFAEYVRNDDDVYEFATEEYNKAKNIHYIKDSSIVDEGWNSVTVSYSNATHKLHVYKTDTLTPEVTVSLTNGIRYQGKWSVAESLNGDNSMLLNPGTYTVSFDATNRQGVIVPYVYLGDLGGNVSDGTATRTSFTSRYTFTIDKDTRFMLVCYIYLNGMTADYYVPKIQLEKNGKETSFSSYNSSKHITNEEANLLKDEFNKQKNLINIGGNWGQSAFNDGNRLYIKTTGGNGGYSFWNKDIPVKLGEKYSVSGKYEKTTGRVIVRAYGSLSEIVESGIEGLTAFNNTYVAFYGSLPCTFEITSNDIDHIRVGFVAIDTADTTVGQYYYYEDIQMEKGEFVTSTSEYVGPIVHEKDLSKYISEDGGEIYGDITLSAESYLQARALSAELKPILRYSRNDAIMIGNTSDDIISYSAIKPDTTVSGQKDLGSSDSKWRNLYLSGTVEAPQGITVGGKSDSARNDFGISFKNTNSKIGVNSSTGLLGIYSQTDVLIRTNDTGSSNEGIRIESSQIYPTITNKINLGTSSNTFKDLYLSGQINIQSSTLGAIKIKRTSSSGGAFLDLYSSNQDTKYTRIGTWDGHDYGVLFDGLVPSSLRIKRSDRSIVKDDTYTYTLPNKTGTVALTSDLSSYLPLSGGTVKGRLSVNGVEANAQEIFYVESTNPVQSIDWVAGFKAPFNGDATNYGTGIKLRNGGYSEHNKWSGIVSHADTSYANTSRLELWASQGASKYKFDKSATLTVTDSSDNIGALNVKHSIRTPAARTKLETMNGRITDANVAHSYENDSAHVQLLQVSSTMTSNKPATDGYILHFSWDNTGVHNAQLFMPNNDGVNIPPQYRIAKDGSWANSSGWHNFITDRNLVTLTQAQYDALSTKDANTYYFIKEG